MVLLDSQLAVIEKVKVSKLMEQKYISNIMKDLQSRFTHLSDRYNLKTSIMMRQNGQILIKDISELAEKIK